MNKKNFTTEIILIHPGSNVAMATEALKEILGSDIKFVKDLIKAINRSASNLISDFESWQLKEEIKVVSKNGILITFQQPKPYISISFANEEDAIDACGYLEHVGIQFKLITINYRFWDEVDEILINKGFYKEEEL